jgi:CRISPR-associated protein Cmr6
MSTFRNNLGRLINDDSVVSNSNASLWLDKFIFDSRKPDPKKPETKNYGKSSNGDDETAKAEIVREVTQKIIEPLIYNDYFHKVWKPNLYSFGAKYREAKVKNRLAINLGSESVLETNISLHRVFGVPFIAGSSLKGMTAAFIRQYGDWKKDKDKDEYNYYITIFGDENNAGFITFYDALYVPNTGFPDKNGVKRPLYADVMTTHHQDYYGSGNVPPADWDGPIPVPFISATGEYLIALSAPEGCEKWLELTFDILGFALATEGIGAKTSSGYGRLKLQDKDGNYSDKYEIQVITQPNSTENNANSVSPSQTVSESQRVADSFFKRINALRNTDVASQIKTFADACIEMKDEFAKKEVAQAIVIKVAEANRETQSKEKKWYQQIKSISEGVEWVVEVTE